MDDDPAIPKVVPPVLKELFWKIVCSFYPPELQVLANLLIKFVCVKEEDLEDRLQIDKKQLRQLAVPMKEDKFVKTRIRMVNDGEEGRANRYQYYFVDYKSVVNVVKYKLDHIRRKIEAEERDLAHRASFVCPECKKTFTDLEAGDLFDMDSKLLMCTFCGHEVQEDTSGSLGKYARKYLLLFNEQFKPVFELLRQCDELTLTEDVMNPDFQDLPGGSVGREKAVSSKPGAAESMLGDISKWSGDSTRNVTFGATSGEISIQIGEKTEESSKKAQLPVWLAESTISTSMPEISTHLEEETNSDDHILQTLLAHESKPNLLQTQNHVAVEPSMSYSDSFDNIPSVNIGGRTVLVSEVTDDMINNMTAMEREEYDRCALWLQDFF